MADVFDGIFAVSSIVCEAFVEDLDAGLPSL